MATVRKCPFGIDARHCKHQETRAKDLTSAMEGELVFLCTIDKPEDCPRMKELFSSALELFNPVLRDKNDTS